MKGKKHWKDISLPSVCRKHPAFNWEPSLQHRYLCLPPMESQWAWSMTSQLTGPVSSSSHSSMSIRTEVLSQPPKGTVLPTALRQWDQWILETNSGEAPQASMVRVALKSTRGSTRSQQQDICMKWYVNTLLSICLLLSNNKNIDSIYEIDLSQNIWGSILILIQDKSYTWNTKAPYIIEFPCRI